MTSQKGKINLPNKLTIMRIILVPFFVLFIVVRFPGMSDTVSRIIAAALFTAAFITDSIDGNLARKHNMVTDFGKTMDPLADKFMIFGALVAITYAYTYLSAVFIWVTLIVIFRELGVTSLRLIVSSTEDVVFPANWAGKLKTVFQCVCVMTVLLEPVIFHIFWPSYDLYILTYVTAAIMTLLTIYSGVNYFRAYWSHIDPRK